MFRAPDSCTLVEGDIHPHGHCRFFEAAAAKAGGHVDPDNARRPAELPLADAITAADVLHTSWTTIRARGLHYTERTVPTADLVALQRVVDGDRVDHDAEIYAEHGQSDAMVPLVLDGAAIERAGKFFILSGHHHAEGAMEAGASELRVQVLQTHDDD